VIRVGSYRGLGGHDAWLDWFGNLEVSHPTPGHPLGRIHYGMDVVTGMALHPDLVQFLAAQELQAPFWIDTSWLAIKHVDEVLSFLPGADGGGMVCVASPGEAAKLGFTVDSFNAGLQRQIDRLVDGGSYTVGGQTVAHPGLKALLAIGEERVVRLPVLFDPVALAGTPPRPGAHSRWSNPVNAVHANGAMLVGEASMPAAVRADVAAKLRGAGVQAVHFIDDRVYQDRWGNVHCATNTVREPPAGFWTRIPPGLPRR
jgi:protein-arginine deiminase